MKKGLYLGAVVWALVCPMRVFAAGQDAVNLSQEGSKVAVSLEMSNAAEEEITAVSLSLKVDTERQAEVDLNFPRTYKVRNMDSYIKKRRGGWIFMRLPRRACLMEKC